MVSVLFGAFASGKGEQKGTGTVIKNEKPKYVFMFIGDGMGFAQVNAARVYLGNNKTGEVAIGNLNFTQFPVVGLATTFDSTSFCPDSASTATSISSGIKTLSAVIGLGVDKKTKPKAISELLKATGKKVGIVTTVTINHATPAAYYAHVDSRNNYYDIALQLADSGFDYFAGGSLAQPTGQNKDQPDAYTILADKGYMVTNKKEEILSLNNKSGKVFAYSPRLQDSGSMPYSIDQTTGDITLNDFVKKGIEVLDNENGFFLMCESGKIDWSSHANDGMTTIKEVLAFEQAIQTAIDFAKKHPNDTLIIVTADHGTGGMSIGNAATGYNTNFALLNKQKMSYTAFDSLFEKIKSTNTNLSFSQILPIIKENFGLIDATDPDALIAENKALVLSELEYKKLYDSFTESMKAPKDRSKTEENKLLYGSYNPLSVTLTHILNSKAGIGWTSYAHTGTPVPVFAIGNGSNAFNGSYDNTDIFKKLTELYNLQY